MRYSSGRSGADEQSASREAFEQACTELLALAQQQPALSTEEMMRRVLARHPGLAHDDAVVAALRDLLVRIRMLSAPVDEALQAFIEQSAHPTSTDTAFTVIEHQRLEDHGLVRPLRPWRTGMRLGSYLLLQPEQPLGEGSSSIVFRALDLARGDLVAVKVLRETLANKRTYARFLAEIQTLSVLDHPNILGIRGWGVEGNVFFLAVELMRAGSLSDRHRPEWHDVRKAVSTVVKIARALAHSHQLGIVHRDLKPQNILFDAGGEPYVSDFGLARDFALQRFVTETGEFVGTPAYMAPEQADGSGKFGPYTDVFAVGACLYHLTVGRLPFEGTTLVESLWKLLKEDPPRPSELVPDYPPELERICLRCLFKEPSDRYETCESVAKDLEQWLAGAEGPIAPRRFLAAVQRRLRPLALAAVGCAMLLLGLVTCQSLGRVPHPPAPLPSASDPPLKLDDAVDAWFHNDVFAARSLIGKRPLTGSRAHPWYKALLRRGLRTNPSKLVAAHRGHAYSAVFSPRRTFLATTGADGAVRLWDPEGQLLETLAQEGAETNGVDISPDEELVVWADDAGRITAWSRARNRQLWQISLFRSPAYPVKILPDQRLVAVGSVDGEVVLLKLHSGQIVARRYLDREATIHALDYSTHRGELLCVSTERAHLWPVPNGPLRAVPRPGFAFQAGCFVSDDEFAVGDRQGVAYLYDADAMVLQRTFNRHAREIQDVCAVEPGRTIATSSSDGTVRFWSLYTARLTGCLVYPQRVWGIGLAANRAMMATATSGGKVAFWDLSDFGAHGVYPVPGEDVLRVHAVSDGGAIVSTSNGSLQRWIVPGTMTPGHLRVRSRRAPPPVQEPSLAWVWSRGKRFSYDHATSTIRFAGGRFRPWTIAKGQLRLAAAVSPDGRTLAFGTPFSSEHGTCLVLLDRHGSHPLRSRLGKSIPQCVRFSPDGKYVVMVDQVGVQIIEPVSRRIIAARQHSSQCSTAAFSPVGTRLAVGHVNGAITVWSVPELQLLAMHHAHGAIVTAVAFDRRGTLVVSGDKKGTVNWQSLTVGSAGGQYTIHRRRAAVISDLRFNSSYGGVYVVGFLVREGDEAELPFLMVIGEP